MPAAAVFLDRDNTLIANDGDLGDPDKVELIQGAASAIASLRGLGYRIIVVTNQGGVARGKYSEDDVERVHQRINEMIKANSGARIDRFYYCPYHPEGTVAKYCREHDWRKPAPGMLIQAAEDLDLDLSQSWMVGDQERDMQAGAGAGVRTILLTPDAELLTPLKMEQIQAQHARQAEAGQMPYPTFTARSLIEAARIIAQQRKPESAEDVRGSLDEKRRWDAGAARAARTATQQHAAVTQPAIPTSAPPPIRATRPFRPWDVPPPIDELPAAGSVMEASPAVAPPPPAPPPPAPTATAERPVHATAPARPAEKIEATAVEQTLREILHELRSQRGIHDNFSYTKMLAVILQMIAVVCFAGSFWMSGDDYVMFLAWMASALFVQLATLAMLQFGR